MEGPPEAEDEAQLTAAKNIWMENSFVDTNPSLENIFSLFEKLLKDIQESSVDVILLGCKEAIPLTDCRWVKVPGKAKTHEVKELVNNPIGADRILLHSKEYYFAHSAVLQRGSRYFRAV
eukprot:TRINITY_DN10810_c0_g1_i2.p1 TRINITY_DN10810_c0_g1~~TRINITY_DN10810_c0_g1_i2.p1  ORF type:complete len:120 (+),score=17.56 TRINITY_DN10810_c0_g1_i2:224-583(+)